MLGMTRCEISIFANNFAPLVLLLLLLGNPQQNSNFHIENGSGMRVEIEGH